jgi:two-component system, OmpR family, response regulator RegX3
MRIALLEDDPDQSVVVKEWLLHSGHQCDCYVSGHGFIRAVKRYTYDILILDWMIPDMSGIEVLLWVRENVSWRIPVIFTTQRDNEEDIVYGLSQGADDYMIKPIKHKELLARIDALGRRSLKTESPDLNLQVEPFEINSGTRQILKNNKIIPTTAIEFDLTQFLFRNYGRVLSRDYILENVWGRNSEVTTRTVDTHVSRIRKKLGIASENQWQLSSVYQHGYRLEKLY